MKTHLGIGAVLAIATVFLAVAPPAGGVAPAGAEKQCSQLPQPPGKAKGIERRCAAGASSGVARADFNGDGFGDLAVGAPFEDIGTAADAGAVYVLYGSPTGLQAPPSGTASPPRAQLWSQDTSGVPGTPEKNDHFGMALAAGDFNNDGTPDLAVGAPGEDNGDGLVEIVYGTSQGLSATSGTVPAPSSIGTGGIPVHPNPESLDLDCIWMEGAGFGAALAWGDFDGDGSNDLVVGAPYADVGVSDLTCTVLGVPTRLSAGAVFLLYGQRASAQRGGKYQAMVQAPRLLSGDEYAEADDRFGEVLAAGNLNGDGTTDLVVGSPFEDVGDVRDAGLVHVFFGCQPRSSCTFASSATQITQNTAGVPSSAERDDLFGAALAIGDFDGNGRSDLAVGVPYEDSGSIADAGAVNVIEFGPGGGLADAELWTQTGVFGSNPDPFEGSTSGPGDAFGWALASADFNGDGKRDLAIGVPFENVFTNRAGTATTVADAGEVDVLYGSSAGLSTTAVRKPQMWHQDAINVEDTAESGDWFGYSLSAWNLGGPGTTADLAVGVPFEDLAAANCGAAAVLYSSAAGTGLSATADQLWHQDVANVPGACEANDKFGWGMY